MKTLLSLAKKLDFTSESEYFEYIIQSYYNGQLTQARELFIKMAKQDKKTFLNDIPEYLPGDIEAQSNIYKYFFQLL